MASIDLNIPDDDLPPDGGRRLPPGAEDTPDDIEREERKRQDDLLQDLRKQNRRDFAEKRLQDAEEERAARRRIRQQQDESRDELQELARQQRQEGSSASDRIVRRLGAFGLARGIGQSGQMFAALAEMLVFQPEEEAARQRVEAIRERREQITGGTREDIRRQQEDLAEDVLLRNLETQRERAKADDLLDDARRRMRDTKDPAEREAILRETGESLISDVSMEAMALKGPSPEQEREQFFRETTPTAGPSGTTGEEFNRNLTTASTELAQFGEGLQTTTKIILGANVALEAINLISENVNNSLKALAGLDAGSPGSAIGFGASIGRPATSLSGGLAGGFFGRNLAQQLAGAGGRAAARSTAAAATGTLGATAGRLSLALGGPVGAAGALAGAALGKGGADAITGPIVTAVETGNSILQDFVSASIGGETLQQSVQQEILTFLRQIEANEAVDMITAEFTEAQGELARAIIQFKEEIILRFGDDLAVIIRLLARFIESLSKIFEYLQTVGDPLGALIGDMGPDIKLAPRTLGQAWSLLVEYMTDNVQANQETANALKEEIGGDQAIDEIEKFFSPGLVGDTVEIKDRGGKKRQVNPFQDALRFFN